MLYALAALLMVISNSLNIWFIISPDPNAQLWQILLHCGSGVILFLIGVTTGERSRIDD